MLVVSDADVIIHLSKLDKLSILLSLYIEVAIPEYIRSEITGKDNPTIHKAINSFLKIFATSKDAAENIAVKHGIHIGEDAIDNPFALPHNVAMKTFFEFITYVFLIAAGAMLIASAGLTGILVALIIIAIYKNSSCHSGY